MENKIRFSNKWAAVFFLFLSLLMGSCSRHKSYEEVQTEMKEAVKNFKLPANSVEGKALVYVIYDKLSYRMTMPGQIGVFYGAIDEKSCSQCNLGTENVPISIGSLGFSGGLKMLERVKLISFLEPREYQYLYLDPGYYLFQQLVTWPSKHEKAIPVDSKPLCLKLESNKIYYLLSSWVECFNGYIQDGFTQYVGFKDQKDLEGQYYLSKNSKRAEASYHLELKVESD